MVMQVCGGVPEFFCRVFVLVDSVESGVQSAWAGVRATAHAVWHPTQTLNRGVERATGYLTDRVQNTLYSDVPETLTAAATALKRGNDHATDAICRMLADPKMCGAISEERRAVLTRFAGGETGLQAESERILSSLTLYDAPRGLVPRLLSGATQSITGGDTAGSRSSLFSFVTSVFNRFSGSNSATDLIPASLRHGANLLVWTLEKAVTHLPEDLEHRDHIEALLNATCDRLKCAVEGNATYGEFRAIGAWFAQQTQNIVPFVMGMPLPLPDGDSSGEEVTDPVARLVTGMNELDQTLAIPTESHEGSYDRMQEKREHLAQTFSYYSTYQYMATLWKGSPEDFTTIMRRVETAETADRDQVFLQALKEQIRSRPELNWLTRLWYTVTLPIRFRTIRYYIQGVFKNFSAYVEGVVANNAHSTLQPIQIEMLNRMTGLFVQLGGSLELWGNEPRGLSLSDGMNEYLSNGQVNPSGKTREALYREATDIACEALIPGLNIFTTALNHYDEKIDTWISRPLFNPHRTLGKIGNTATHAAKWVIGSLIQLVLWPLIKIFDRIERGIDHFAKRGIQSFANDTQLMRNSFEQFQANYNRVEFTHPIQQVLMQQLESLVHALDCASSPSAEALASEDTKSALKGAISNLRSLLEKWGYFTPEEVKKAFQRHATSNVVGQVSSALYNQVVSRATDAVVDVLLLGSENVLKRGALYDRIGELFAICDDSITQRNPIPRPTDVDVRSVEERIANARQYIIQKVINTSVDRTLSQLSNNASITTHQYLEQAKEILKMGPGEEEELGLITLLENLQETRSTEGRKQLAERIHRSGRQLISSWLNLISRIQETDTHLTGRVKGILLKQLAPINQLLVHLDPIGKTSSEEGSNRYQNQLEQNVKSIREWLETGNGQETATGFTSALSMLKNGIDRFSISEKVDGRILTIENAFKTSAITLQRIADGANGYFMTVSEQIHLMQKILEEISAMSDTALFAASTDPNLREQVANLMQIYQDNIQNLERYTEELKDRVGRRDLLDQLLGDEGRFNELVACKRETLTGGGGGMRAMGAHLRGFFAEKMAALFPGPEEQNGYIRAMLTEIGGVRDDETLTAKAHDIKQRLIQTQNDDQNAIEELKAQVQNVADNIEEAGAQILGRLEVDQRRYNAQVEGNRRVMIDIIHEIFNHAKDLKDPDYIHVGPSLLSHNLVKDNAKQILVNLLGPLFEKSTKLLTNPTVIRAAIDTLVIEPFVERKGRPPSNVYRQGELPEDYEEIRTP